MATAIKDNIVGGDDAALVQDSEGMGDVLKMRGEVILNVHEDATDGIVFDEAAVRVKKVSVGFKLKPTETIMLNSPMKSDTGKLPLSIESQ
jgi:hypothetical protein